MALYKTIEILEKSIWEQLRIAGLKEIAEQEKINIASLLWNLSSKYLSYYIEDIKEELLYDMFVDVYLRKLEQLEETYNKKQKLYTFLYSIMKNSLIYHSNKRLQVLQMQKDVNPIEDESEGEAWDRVTMGKSSVKTTSTYGDDLYYDSLIEDYTNLLNSILLEEREVDNPKKVIDSLKKKIDKLKEQKYKAEGFMSNEKIVSSKFADMYRPDYNDIDVEGEEDYKKYVDMLKNKLLEKVYKFRQEYIKSWDDKKLKVIDLLINDFSFSEIAYLYGVTGVTISKWVEQIKDAFIEVGEELEFFTDDNSLINSIIDWLDCVDESKNTKKILRIDMSIVEQNVCNLFGEDFLREIKQYENKR